MTRIIAGAAKGRRLAVPKLGTRPTSDRVRESLFSAVSAHFLKVGVSWSELVVLDLYAGTGALGLEALSRGAHRVLLIEKTRAAGAVIEANIKVVALPGAQLLIGDVTAVIERLGAEPFGLVLVDPPYEVSSEAIATLLTALQAYKTLASEALVVVERPTGGGQAPFPASWRVLRQSGQGDTTLWYGQAPENVLDCK
ncbi:MAG: 16S rRNA (guanine(966)-N(2))-methyltransferase RsmD [Candidatus Nanopelagicales bacterium]|nr:16S rRNA (guanine(966)-N(2))-methyltransferase RsmD [Candidatus Nanopelagicales bacterium]